MTEAEKDERIAWLEDEKASLEEREADLVREVNELGAQVANLSSERDRLRHDVRQRDDRLLAVHDEVRQLKRAADEAATRRRMFGQF